MLNDKIPIKKIVHLIELTASNRVDWISMNVFKAYLRDLNLSLNSVTVIHRLLGVFQTDRFIFDCGETYLTCIADSLYMFSKSKYSLEYRLDVLSLKEKCPVWKRCRVSISVLLRLRNAIVATNNRDDCDALMSSMALSCSA